MSITTEQLRALADLLNERRAEWPLSLEPLSLGEVRSIYDAMLEWQAKQSDAGAEQSAYEAGYGDGRAVTAAIYANGSKINGKTNGKYTTPQGISDYIAANPPFGAPEPNGSNDTSEDRRDCTIERRRENEPAYTIVAPLVPRRNAAPRTIAEADELLAELSAIIAALRDMARDGAMPSIVAWDSGKPDHLPVWQVISRRHEIPSWGKLAEICGLAFNPARSRLSRPERRERERMEAQGAGHHTPRGSYIPTEQELLAEIRRQAMGGVAPTVKAFDRARPATWATAQAHTLRLGKKWSELAEMAELKPNPSRYSDELVDEMTVT